MHRGKLIVDPNKPRPQGAPDPQAAVRVAHFERAMQAFNLEIGQKTAFTLQTAFARYHEREILPLIRRLEYLEMPLYRRAWKTIMRWAGAAKLWAATTFGPNPQLEKQANAAAEGTDQTPRGPDPGGAGGAGGEEPGRKAVDPASGPAETAAG